MPLVAHMLQGVPQKPFMTLQGTLIADNVKVLNNYEQAEAEKLK